MNSREDFEVLAGQPVEIESVPDGPMLLRRADALRAADGTEFGIERPVVAVCMCGFSRRAPWCDGTHKAAKTSSNRSIVITVGSSGFDS